MAGDEEGQTLTWAEEFRDSVLKTHSMIMDLADDWATRYQATDDNRHLTKMREYIDLGEDLLRVTGVKEIPDGSAV